MTILSAQSIERLCIEYGMLSPFADRTRHDPSCGGTAADHGAGCDAAGCSRGDHGGRPGRDDRTRDDHAAAGQALTVVPGFLDERGRRFDRVGQRCGGDHPVLAEPLLGACRENGIGFVP